MVTRLKFTKTLIKDLPAPQTGKRETYYDTECPRLAVRVTSTGSKTFYVVKRAAGGVVWVKLDVFPDMTVGARLNLTTCAR